VVSVAVVVAPQVKVAATWWCVDNAEGDSEWVCVIDLHINRHKVT
jgi:hypothetical protein